MVKGIARPQGAAASSSAGAAPQHLPTMTAGQNPADPLTQLNGHMGHGVMAGLNPFADLGVNPQDPNFVREASRLAMLSDVERRWRSSWTRPPL